MRNQHTHFAPRPARRRQPLLAAAALALACACAGAGAAPLGTELLRNGNAEAGSTTAWDSSGLVAVRSDQAGTLGLAAGQSTGDWTFTADPSFVSAAGMSQVVDVSEQAALIDAGQALITFSALVQSRNGSGATAYAIFLDASGERLVAWPPLTDTQRLPGVFDWNAAQISGPVFAGTRQVEILVTITSTRGDAASYVDNMSLVLTAVPEASTASTLLLGLLALRWRARRSAA